MRFPIPEFLALLVLASGAYDLRFRRIPNWLVLAGLLAGIGIHSVRDGWTGLRTALLGIGVAALVYLPLFALRAMGGGDAKLMMAIGALAGPPAWIAIFALTAIFGGVVAVFVLVLRGKLARAGRNLIQIFRALLKWQAPYTENPELDVRNSASMRLPHGVVIAAGTLVYLGFVRLGIVP